MLENNPKCSVTAEAVRGAGCSRINAVSPSLLFKAFRDQDQSQDQKMDKGLLLKRQMVILTFLISTSEVILTPVQKRYQRIS